MNGIKDAIFTYQSIRFLGKSQYTFNAKSRSTTTALKHWVELLLGVEAKVANCYHLLSAKGWDMFGDIHCTTDMRYLRVSSFPPTETLLAIDRKDVAESCITNFGIMILPMVA